MLALLIILLTLVSWGVSIVCWILTLNKCFKSGEKLLGFFSIFSLGGFIIGWLEVERFDHLSVMTLWSASWIMFLVLHFINQGITLGFEYGVYD